MIASIDSQWLCVNVLRLTKPAGLWVKAFVSCGVVEICAGSGVCLGEQAAEIWIGGKSLVVIISGGLETSCWDFHRKESLVCVGGCTCGKPFPPGFIFCPLLRLVFPRVLQNIIKSLFKLPFSLFFPVIKVLIKAGAKAFQHPSEWAQQGLNLLTVTVEWFHFLTLVCPPAPR